MTDQLSLGDGGVGKVDERSSHGTPATSLPLSRTLEDSKGSEGRPRERSTDPETPSHLRHAPSVETLRTPRRQNAHARRTDPLSSHLAAEKVRVTETQELVLHLLRICGPATDPELVTRWRDYWPEMKATDQSIRSRRGELVAKGLVEFSGEWGVSEHGNRARVWRAVVDA